MSDKAVGDKSVIKTLLKHSFNKFLSNRAIHKNDELKQNTKKVLDYIEKSGFDGLSPVDVYECLRLACRTGVHEVVLESVDCIGKLFICNYWIPAISSYFHVGDQNVDKKDRANEVRGFSENDSISSHQINDDASRPRVDDDASRPRVDDDTSRPRVDDDASRPRVDGDVSRPQIDGDASRPQIDDDTSRPREDDDTSRPQIDDDTSRPQIDDDTSRPQIDDDTSRPQIDDDASRSRVDDDASRPRVDDDASRTSQMPNYKSVKVFAPLGPLDNVDLVEQLTEPDVFDMLIFSECLQLQIYSKLMGIIASTIVETTSSDPPLEIQVIKVFLAALSATSRHMPIYTGVIYTRAFRAIYSIFCTSKSLQSQKVAQAAIVQITGQVFDNLAMRTSPKIGYSCSETNIGSQDGSHDTIDINIINMENHGSELVLSDPDNSDIVLSFYIISILCLLTNKSSVVVSSHQSNKALARIHTLRSNLITLHLLNMIIRNYPKVLELKSRTFWYYTHCHNYSINSSPTLINACRKLLRLALCTNLLNIHPQAFDLTAQIVFNIFIHLRKHLKKELSIIIGEIILPILENKSNALTFHKMSIITSFGLALSKNTHEGVRALVEAYLNYDCDPHQGERSSIWNRLINALAKIVCHLFETPTSTIFNLVAPNNIFGYYIPNPQTLMQFFDCTDALKYYKDTPINNNEYYTRSDFYILKVIAFSALNTTIGCLYQWIVSEGSKTKTIISTKPGVNDFYNNSSQSSPLINDSPNTMKLLKRKKNDVVTGVNVFNSDPRQSLDFLLENKIIPSKSPKDIANFISVMSGLDKSTIGEFIGSGNQYSADILMEFMMIQDYSNMTMVMALRKTLQLFKIPGEAQKIDRIMIAFAKRYVECNPDSMFTSESAYVTSFSIIMLNTDQHNHNVKKRMTKMEFIKNVRTSSDCKNIPDSILEMIYDSVKSNKLSVMGSPYTTSVLPGRHPSYSSPFARRESISQNLLIGSIIPKISDYSFEETIDYNDIYESNSSILESSLKLDESQRYPKKASFSYISASRVDHIMDMFQSVWAPCLTSFNVASEQLNDSVPYNVVFKGFENCLKITFVFDLTTERQAFISILKNISTNLNAETLNKCIYSAEVLLKMAIQHGDMLKDNWEDILYSAINLYTYCEHHSLTGNNTNELFNENDSSSNASRSTSAPSSTRQNNVRQRQNSEKSSNNIAAGGTIATIQESMKEGKNTIMIFEKDDRNINELISSFRLLLDEMLVAILEMDNLTLSFVIHSMKKLCMNKYALENRYLDFHIAILERASYIYCNRIPQVLAEWDLLWPQFRNLFMHIISNDELRDISITCLKIYTGMTLKFFSTIKINYPSYKENQATKFKRDMLLVYDNVIDALNSNKSRRAVFMSISEIIGSSFENIKGAWKEALNVTLHGFEGYVNDSSKTGYNLDYIEVTALFYSISNSYEKISSLYEDRALGTLVNLYFKFCKEDRAEIFSVKFVNILKSLLTQVMEVDIIDAKTCKISTEYIDEEKKKNLTIEETTNLLNEAKSSRSLLAWTWILVLKALVDIAMDCEIEARNAAIDNFLEIIEEFYSKISDDIWNLIIDFMFRKILGTDFSFLIRRYFKTLDSLYVWIYTTQINALNKFVNLYNSLFNETQFLLNDALDLLIRHITSPIDITSKNGIRCMELFFDVMHDKLSEEQWNLIIKRIAELFEMPETHTMKLVESKLYINYDPDNGSLARLGNESRVPEEEFSSTGHMKTKSDSTVMSHFRESTTTGHSNMDRKDVINDDELKKINNSTNNQQHVVNVESELGVNKDYLCQMIRDIIRSSKIKLFHLKIPISCLSILLTCLQKSLLNLYPCILARSSTESGMQNSNMLDSLDARFNAFISSITYIVHHIEPGNYTIPRLISDVFSQVFISCCDLHRNLESPSNGLFYDDRFVSRVCLVIEELLNELCKFNEACFVLCNYRIYNNIIDHMKNHKDIFHDTVTTNFLEALGRVYIFGNDKNKTD